MHPRWITQADIEDLVEDIESHSDDDRDEALQAMMVFLYPSPAIQDS